MFHSVLKKIDRRLEAAAEDLLPFMSQAVRSMMYFESDNTLKRKEKLEALLRETMLEWANGGSLWDNVIENALSRLVSHAIWVTARLQRVWGKTSSQCLLNDSNIFRGLMVSASWIIRDQHGRTIIVSAHASVERQGLIVYFNLFSNYHVRAALVECGRLACQVNDLTSRYSFEFRPHGIYEGRRYVNFSLYSADLVKQYILGSIVGVNVWWCNGSSFTRDFGSALKVKDLISTRTSS